MTTPRDAIGLSERLIEGAKEALAVVRGEQPAARLHINGHAYVPATQLDALQDKNEQLQRSLTSEQRLAHGLSIELRAAYDRATRAEQERNALREDNDRFRHVALDRLDKMTKAARALGRIQRGEADPVSIAADVLRLMPWTASNE